MVIISFVMIISFSVIYGLTYVNTYNTALENIKRSELKIFNNIRNPFEENEEYDEEITSFRLYLHEDFSLSQISSELEISDDVYFNIVEGIKNTEELTGIIEIEDKKYLYSVTQIPKDGIHHEIFEESFYRVEFMNVNDVFNTLNLLLIILITVGLVVLVIIYFISLYFANKAIKPLEIIWNKQKQFVADATHELKTPITIINANVDAIKLNKEDLVSEQFRWLDYIKKETYGMNKLINELLTSAKADEEKYELVSCNISEVVSDVVLTFETVIFEKNIKLKTNVEKDITFNTDVSKLEQVIKILIDNAIKYNKNNGYLNISLKKIKKNIYITVENSGVGISRDEIDLVFERFYKSDKSRSDNSYGLGLYIAKTIVTKLGGKLLLDSEVNKKTTFTIKL